MAGSLRGIIFDNYGRLLSGVSITVKKMGTETLASLYSDEALTVGIGNPLTTEDDGSYLAFAANGKYDLVLSKTGVSFDATDAIAELIWDEMITRSAAATTSLTEKDHVLLCDASAAPFTVNLLALSAVDNGRKFVIVKIDSTANAVTIDPDGGETINGAAMLALSGSKQGVIIRKAGAEWITDLPPASVTAGAGKIPLGRASDTKLDKSWGGAADSLCDLDASVLVPLARIPTTLNGKTSENSDKVDGEHAGGGLTLAASKLALRDESGGLVYAPSFLHIINFGCSKDWLTTSIVGTGASVLYGGHLLQQVSAANNDLTRDANTNSPFLPQSFLASGKKAIFEWIVQPVAITTVERHCRMAAVNTAPVTTDVYFGFKIINARVWTGSGNGVPNETDTGVDVSAGTFVRLKAVYTPGTDIKFYVNGTLKATHTTDLPSVSSVLNYCVLQTKTITAVPQSTEWFSLKAEFEY